MLREFILVFIILNLIYEIIETIFPASKMRECVKSFVRLIVFYVICDYVCKLL